MTFSAISPLMRDFLRCQKRSLPTWEAKTKPRTPPRVQKLGWVFSTSGTQVQRNEARKLKDIPCRELDAILCRFFRWNSKKGRSRLRTRKFGCHAVLVRPSFEKLWQKLPYFARSWICKLEATTVEVKAREFRAQGYRKRKNASYALSEADDHFLWSSAILVCLSLRIIAWLSSAQ